MALREVYAAALKHNDPQQAQRDLRAWLSWAKRSRLQPLKHLAKTLSTNLAGVISGMVDNRSNAFVEAMNGLLQQAKRATWGFRTASNLSPAPTCACPSCRICRITHSSQLHRNDAGRFHTKRHRAVYVLSFTSGLCARRGSGLCVDFAHAACSAWKDSITPRITSLARKSAQLRRGI